MIRNYELTLLARQDASDEDVKMALQTLRDIILSNNSSILYAEYWGLRQLEYQINKNDAAHFYFIQFNSEATQLYLIINTAKDPDFSFIGPCRQITATICPYPIMGKEGRRRLVRQINIAATNLLTANHQLATYANWQWIAKGISYIELGIGYRRTNSHHLAFHHFLGGTAHGGLCRSIYV